MRPLFGALFFHVLPQSGRFSLILLICCFLSLPSVSRAQSSKLALLQQGSTPDEVIRILGEPADRHEREAKREVVWEYPQSEVLFREGLLVSWEERKTHQEVEADRRAVQQEKQVKEAREREIAARAEPSAVEDIISEILKEVPTDNSPSAPVPGQIVPGDPRALEVMP